MTNKYNNDYFDIHIKGGYEKQKNNPTFQKRIDEFKALGYKEGKILDIGCAYGYFLEHCRNAGYETLGLDVSDIAIKKAQEDNSGNIFIHDIGKDKFPMKDASINIISMFNTLEHIENYPYAIRECYRLLKKGGLLYIYVPTLSRWMTDKTHINYFTIETLRFVLENEGYKILKIGEEGGKMRNLFGIVRLLFNGNTNFNFIPKGTGSFISCFAKKI